MGRNRGMQLMMELMATKAKEQGTADAITRKGRDARKTRRLANEALGTAKDASDSIVRDDETPPKAPQKVIVVPFYHQVEVSWFDPLESDYVEYAIVEAKPEGESVWRRFTGSKYSAILLDLDTVPTEFRVRFVDRWGRQGDYSQIVTATPMPTAAEVVDLTKAEISGSLGWENLDALDSSSGLTLAQRQEKLGDDVITGRAMAAQNLAATRLWVETGAFESAFIKDLSVDKLTAGLFTAGAITLAGLGELKAGRTRVSDKGIALPVLGEFTGAPDDLDGKISNLDGNTDIHFYREAGGSNVSGHRGMVITARGDGGNVRGNLMLEARWGLTSSRAAYVGIGSMSENATADVYLGPSLKVEGDLQVNTRAYVKGNLIVDGNITPNGFFTPRRELQHTIASNGYADYSHNLGYIPRIITAYVAVNNGWRMLPTSPGSGGIDIYITEVNANSMRILNLSPSSQRILLYVY